MKPFNIRKLKIKLTNKEKELRRARPGPEWNRVRLERKTLQVALAIAKQNRIDKAA